VDHPSTIILVLPIAWKYARDALVGIRQYTRTHQRWRVAVDGEADPTSPNFQQRVAATQAGLLISADAKSERLFRRLGRPTVNISARSEETFGARVLPDNVAIGKLAAQHFLERGFRNFAYVGYNHYYSIQRRSGFVQDLQAAGFRPRLYDFPLAIGPDESWLEQLPRPLGLFACNDHYAVKLCNAVLKLGLRVPEDLAILGVDNDDVFCELAEVPLSSVDPNYRRVGYEAAALLARLMDGKPAPKKPIVIPPGGLITRASTDMLAIEDPELARAMRYIQVHACDPMSVAQMLDELSVSRRTLEKRFHRRFGRTPHDEIRRVQFERAKQLLAESDLKIPDVARRSGFKDPKRFTTLFHEAFGMPPVAYRERFRTR
jgi:LacI family transcriptional regulator